MLENKYKIIFVDIDGTLVDDEKNISKETSTVIKKLKDSGVYTVLTSGKPYKSIETFSKKCNATPYLIGSNGAIVKDFEKDITIFSKEIELDTAIKILDVIREYETYTMVTVGGNLLVAEEKFGMYPPNRPEVIKTLSLLKYFKNMNNPILKFSIIDGNKEKITKIRETLLNIPDINITPVDIIGIPQKFRKAGENYPNPYCIDIMPENVTKAEAIKALINYLNIDVSATIAIGDGMNDIEMLETVNYKIAMENAVQELKDIADMITLSNNNSGVAIALNKIFFNKK